MANFAKEGSLSPNPAWDYGQKQEWCIEISNDLDVDGWSSLEARLTIGTRWGNHVSIETTADQPQTKEEAVAQFDGFKQFVTDVNEAWSIIEQSIDNHFGS